MRIDLLAHACVIIGSKDVKILCDPWLQGKAFNDSWSLFPEPVWRPEVLSEIDYLWVSHEHPDHFHIPTLRSLPDAFKQRVCVLHQETHSDKMWRAFGQLGFSHFGRLPHRKLVPLTPNTSVYCYQDGLMDSALAVLSDGQLVLNANDVELREFDCRLIRRDIGSPDLLLNQFSVAGYGGEQPPEGPLAEMAAGVLTNMTNNHRDLGAKRTIPFASYMYFSSIDNGYLNSFINRPGDVAAKFSQEGLDLIPLPLGRHYEIGEQFDVQAGLEELGAQYSGFADLELDPSPVVDIQKLSAAYADLTAHLRKHYPRRLLALLRPVRIGVPDLDLVVDVSVPGGTFVVSELEHPVDLEVLSQPLWFTFRFPFGSQTLGVSGRAKVYANRRNWRLHRVLFALNNAEVYLKPRLLFTRRNFSQIRTRHTGFARQLIRRFRR